MRFTFNFDFDLLASDLIATAGVFPCRDPYHNMLFMGTGSFYSTCGQEKLLANSFLLTGEKD